MIENKFGLKLGVAFNFKEKFYSLNYKCILAARAPKIIRKNLKHVDYRKNFADYSI